MEIVYISLSLLLSFYRSVNNSIFSLLLSALPVSSVPVTRQVTGLLKTVRLLSRYSP